MAEGMVLDKIIEVAGVVKRYGDKTVVRDVDLSVRSGERMVLIGHNGAGKTTLMKLMLGLTHADAGRVRILGSNPATAAAGQRRSIGYLPESVAFHSAMKGREVLAFYARLKAVTAAECHSILAQVGLDQAADQRVSTYSKGMRQRLGLAQAMLGKPRLLFLDEPTSGLDPSLRRQFYDLIDTLSLSGTTSLTSSHSLNEVEARADRIAIMKSGSIVACGTLAELSRQTDLPIVVRLRVATGHASDVAGQLAPMGEIHRVNDHGIDLSCLGTSKMVLFRSIAGLGEVIEDMDVVLPRLDDIYNHYMENVQPQ
ncbi:MAG: ATP-binding cassette domain-containing protein [Thermotogales bacterium]|nr:ATP-binding cassette domain-containing protein [Thermotogales bacterium]